MSNCTYIKIEGKKDKKAFRRFKKDLKRILRQIKKRQALSGLVDMIYFLR